jgi:urease accessory protein
MNTLIQRLIVGSVILTPIFAHAHPGHHVHDAGFWTGFIHPFTGLDHLMMALAFGVLMWTATQRWKITGAISLVLALVIGFVLGAKTTIFAGFAESGIIASLIILAIALWTKSKTVFPIAVALLATFHGVAHGTELASNGHVALQILGMVSAMSILYVAGLLIGQFMIRYIPYGKKIIGTLAAIVAVIGLA